MYLNWNVSDMTVIENEITIESEFLKRYVAITLLLPDGREPAEPISLLL